ncbi:MAG: hypothetical protein F6K17_05150 [Okeania sp. SIO3C4]|nr:hypothetical protein [Okeania sp. SIO3C4]
MLKISYKIKIGSTTITEGKETTLLEVRTNSSLNIPANSCYLTLASPQNLKISPDSPISVELGYDKKTTLVFTGKVSTINWEINQVRIEGISSLENLIITHFNSLYEKSTAGDIVKDILKQGKLKSEKVENGIKFSSYALGNTISAYDHLQRLAQQCGFDTYANTKDKILFAKYKPSTTHELTYGEDILSLSLEKPSAGIGKVEIYGESPASQGQGEKAASWLTKKEVKGTAGNNSGVTLRLVEPAARTQASAQKIAQGIYANLHEKQRGKMKIIGNPQVKLGDGIKITKMPISQQNGTFKVTGVSQILNYRRGFFTIINWEES